jgi:hypothetical protein
MADYAVNVGDHAEFFTCAEFGDQPKNLTRMLSSSAAVRGRLLPP